MNRKEITPKTNEASKRKCYHENKHQNIWQEKIKINSCDDDGEEADGNVNDDDDDDGDSDNNGDDGGHDDGYGNGNGNGNGDDCSDGDDVVVGGGGGDDNDDGGGNDDNGDWLIDGLICLFITLLTDLSYKEEYMAEQQ